MALVKLNKWRLPLIRQRDITDCGAACLASVCSYYGLYIAVSRLRQMAGTDRKGTSVMGIVEAATALGLIAKGVRASYEALACTTLPAIVHVITEEKVSHYMVLIKSCTKHVVVMDPAEGRIKKIKTEEFRKIWTGVTVLLMPGENFCCNEKISHFDRIKELIYPFKQSLILAFVCAVLVSLLGLVMSVYVKEIVDEILVHKKMLLLNILSAIVMIIFVIQFLLNVIKSTLVFRTGKSINSSLIMAYYRHVSGLPQSFFDNMRTGEMLSRINDAVKITSFIHDVAINLLVDVLIIIFSLALMFYYNWKISLFIILIIPVYGLLYYINNSINKRWQHKIAVSGADLEASLVESLGAATTIRHLALEKFFIARIEGKLDNLLKTLYSSSSGQLYVQAGADLISKVFMILLLWTGSYYVINNRLTVGEMMSFYTLLAWFTVPVLYLLGANKTFSEAVIAANRLFEIMVLQPDENGWKKIFAGKNLNIDFKNVHFRYGNNEPLLKGINISVGQGNILGITGKSGSGKSTLASLLLRSYKPSAGKITINDVDLNEIDKENLSGMISIVAQKTDLFTASISENITLGCGYDPERLNDICERLGITHFTSLFPDGMNTIITEQGNNLSGGQKQRISIARALYRNTPVLILDEATASVDAGSEEKIMQTIEWYKNNGNTVILIAHNDSTLKICDNIVVLEDGVIQ